MIRSGISPLFAHPEIECLVDHAERLSLDRIILRDGRISGEVDPDLSGALQMLEKGMLPDPFPRARKVEEQDSGPIDAAIEAWLLKLGITPAFHDSVQHFKVVVGPRDMSLKYYKDRDRFISYSEGRPLRKPTEQWLSQTAVLLENPPSPSETEIAIHGGVTPILAELAMNRPIATTFTPFTLAPPRPLSQTNGAVDLVADEIRFHAEDLK